MLLLSPAVAEQAGDVGSNVVTAGVCDSGDSGDSGDREVHDRHPTNVFDRSYAINIGGHDLGQEAPNAGAACGGG